MSIFPLPLAPFEHLMLADDCPDHPMNFFVQMKFQGRFDRPQLNAALQTALTLHPLLNSRIRGSAKDPTSRITWIDADSPPPTIDWNDADVPIRFAARRWMDLKSETGIRLWLRETDTTTTLMLQIHHCCCDGIGTSSFIITLLTAYHLLHTSASTSAMEKMFDPRLLRDRDPSCSTWQRILKTAWNAVFRVAPYFTTSPVPLATPHKLPLDDFGGDQFPRFHTVTFDEADTEQIEMTAKRLGVSLNVLLLRDLFVILDQWNRLHSPDCRSRTIRVSIPINLRRPIDHRMPAANMVSLLFLDREANQLADPMRLLGNLHTQIEETLRLRKHLVFIPALKLVGMFRGRLAARMQRTKCLASALMSNLGVLGPRSRSPLSGVDGRLVSGGLILETIEVVLPIRPLTHAVFAALTYSGKLSLTVSYDPRWIDAADGFELLESFVRELKASLRKGRRGQPSTTGTTTGKRPVFSNSR
jgi:NRPS condensation-like uncharacterized protein